MFSRPFFPSWSSSMFDDPFSRDPFFSGRDTFMDEWNDLLRQQWADQQRFRERASRSRQPQQQQLQQQPQQQQQQIKDTGSSNMDVERKYDTNNQQVATTNTGTSGTVARPRTFWDLSSFPSWSDLTPQQIKLDWSGTEPSAKEYVVSATLPDGMNPNDMTISVDERSRLMTLKCQTKSHEEEKDKDGNVISSRSSSSFTQRSIQLPRDVDLSNISASKSNISQGQAGGAQLLLHLPKLANPVPEPGVKRITIQ